MHTLMRNARVYLRAALVLRAVSPSLLPAQGANSLAASQTQRIDSVAVAELASTRTPGSALVIVQGDRIVYAKGYGVANVETGQPVTPDLLFRLGSTTKMMTSIS